MTTPREQASREPKDCNHRVRHEHGTPMTYRVDACRCDPCSDAYRAYKTSWRQQRQKPGNSGYHDAGPVREHLLELRKKMPFQDIVEQSGLSGAAIAEILNGERMHVQDLTAGTILSLRPVARSPKGLIPSDGARRRLQGLVYDGWPPPVLAVELGANATLPVLRLLRGDQPMITMTRHDAVAALCRRLANAQPPQKTSGKGNWPRVRYQAWARDQGWVPLAAWDDIDDPDETPKGVADEAALRPWERREEILFQVAQRRRPEEIGPLVGVTASYVADVLRGS